MENRLKASTEKIMRIKEKVNMSFEKADTLKQTSSSDPSQVVFIFENNKYAKAVFGKFDENLAYIEKTRT